MMPLKLFKIEQSQQINGLLEGRNIIHNGENSSNNMFNEVYKRADIYVFISLEIAISKWFKKYILDHFFFIDRLCLLADNEIHLVKKWSKNFCPILKNAKKNPLPCFFSRYIINID